MAWGRAMTRPITIEADVGAQGAAELLRRADLIIAHLLVVRGGGEPDAQAEADIESWIEDSRAAVLAAVDATTTRTTT
jgi:hypothetical protein